MQYFPQTQYHSFFRNLLPLHIKCTSAYDFRNVEEKKLNSSLFTANFLPNYEMPVLVLNLFISFPKHCDCPTVESHVKQYWIVYLLKRHLLLLFI